MDDRYEGGACAYAAHACAALLQLQPSVGGEDEEVKVFFKKRFKKRISDTT